MLVSNLFLLVSNLFLLVCCLGKAISMVCIHMAKGSWHYKTPYVRNETSFIIYTPASSWNEKAPCTFSL